jgi:hypothetical protein
MTVSDHPDGFPRTTTRYDAVSHHTWTLSPLDDDDSIRSTRNMTESVHTGDFGEI